MQKQLYTRCLPGKSVFLGFSYPRLKQRLAFVTPDTGNLSSVLECVRACDSVLFLWPLTPTLDDISERLYSCLYAQGLPATAHAAMASTNATIYTAVLRVLLYCCSRLHFTVGYSRHPGEEAG